MTAKLGVIYKAVEGTAVIWFLSMHFQTVYFFLFSKSQPRNKTLFFKIKISPHHGSPGEHLVVFTAPYHQGSPSEHVMLPISSGTSETYGKQMYDLGLVLKQLKELEIQTIR